MKACPQLTQNLRGGGTAELEKRIVTAVDTEVAKIKAEESLEQQSTLMHSFYPWMMAAVAGVPDDTFKNVLKSKLVQVSAIQERTQSSQRLVAISRAIEQIKGVAE